MINRLSSLCLLLTMGVTIGYKLFGGIMALISAATALVLFLCLQWPQINTTARTLLGAALASIFLLGMTPEPLATLETAFSRAIYFATFLVALAFLRLAAKHSLMVKRCGKLVVNQPPARRYGIISFAAYLFGTVLNFGVLHLLGQMIGKGNTLASAGGLTHVQEKRRQRMSLALLRGFSVLPLASPFSITMTLMLATIPDLHWLSLLPIGILTAALMILLGWGLDYVPNPKQAPTAALYTGPTLSWRPAWQFLGLVLMIFSLAALVEQQTSATLPLAIMLLSPLLGLIWMSWGYRRIGPYKALWGALGRIGRELPLEINALRSEISILSGACFFGVIVSDLLPHDTLIELVQALHLSGVPLTIATCALVTLLAQFGINPIASVTVIASTLTPAAAFGLSPELLALGLMCGWCLAMNSSPVSISALLISQTTDCLPKTLTHRWNGTYTLTAFIASSLWLGALSQFMGF